MQMGLILGTIFTFLLCHNVLGSSGKYHKHMENIIELEWGDNNNYQTDLTSSLLFHLNPSQNIAFMLSCVEVKINSSDEDFEMIYADTDISLNEENWYQTASDTLSKMSRWFAGKSGNGSEKVKGYCSSPYKELYILIKPRLSGQNFQVETRIIIFDLSCCLCLISGLLLFYMAEKLSKSSTFYYTSGTSVGVLASILLLVFMLSRMLPKKKLAYTLLFGGWTICAWILTKIWGNLSEMLTEHYYLLAGYILISGFLSFIFLYRYGPVIDPRSNNIIQWSIQVLSVLLIYNGTQLPKFSLTIIFGIFIQQLLTNSKTKENFGEIILTLKRFKLINKLLGKYGDPKPRKLLTEDQYRIEAEIETKKALEELRQFCQSPKCSPWKTLLRIETPKKFAKFIEGDHHLSEAEMSCYDNDMDITVEEIKEEDGFISDDEEEESFKLTNLDVSSDEEIYW